MRVLLDLTPLQGASSFHGIGRVTYELSKRLIPKLEEPIVFFCSLNPEKGLRIREEFQSLNPHTRFEVLELAGFTTYFDLYEKTGQTSTFLPYELLYEWKISQSNPHFVLIFSVFEWDHPVSLGKLTKNFLNFVIAHDLIPYLFKSQYLTTPAVEKWYFHKLEDFKKADYYFANSQCTKMDLVNHLKIDEERVKVIPLGCDARFRPLSDEEKSRAKLELKSLGIKGDFILYVPSSSDARKNLEGLIKAFSLLDRNLKKRFQLVISSKLEESHLSRFKNLASSLGLTENLLFTGYLSDEWLVKLYNCCTLFVHPSFYEGFGLPLLEAMKCGAPAIGSNTSSLKELLQIEEALFDPHHPEEMAQKITKALTDENFRQRLKENSLKQQERYSWERAVDIIFETLKESFTQKFKRPSEES